MGRKATVKMNTGKKSHCENETTGTDLNMWTALPSVHNLCHRFAHTTSAVTKATRVFNQTTAVFTNSLCRHKHNFVFTKATSQYTGSAEGRLWQKPSQYTGSAEGRLRQKPSQYTGSSSALPACPTGHRETGHELAINTGPCPVAAAGHVTCVGRHTSAVSNRPKHNWRQSGVEPQVISNWLVVTIPDNPINS